MCLYSRLLTNKKYTANKKNGGVIPRINDERVKLVPVGCGRCIECRKQKAREWQIRMLKDIKTNKNGKFITLTFSNESIRKLIKNEDNIKATKHLKNLEGYALDNEIATVATRLFLERWRKQHKKSLRHFLITELGHEGTENIHMHGIIWTNETYEEIEKHWKYGFIWPKKEQRKQTYVNEKTINYIIKYIHKQDEKHPNYKSKILTTDGIGGAFIRTNDSKQRLFRGTDTIETYRTTQGYDIAMPTYWRNKIYTEEEREKLWLQKLDKNERWICGEKVKANDEQAYYKLLKWYRKKNKKLGYGTDEKDWNQIQYETERRKLLIENRMSATRLTEVSASLPHIKQDNKASGGV